MTESNPLIFELPHDEYRARLRLALLKDKTDLKKLREKNVAEQADVSDIDHKLKLLDGDKNGTPGLIQIFSTQYELLAEKKAKADPDQITIDDAIAEQAEMYADGKWSEDAPEPRPKAGDRVRSLDGRGILVITEPVGYRPLRSEEGNEAYAVFIALAVPVAKTDGYTEDDLLQIFLAPESVRNEEGEWSECPPPPVDVNALKEAVKIGEAKGEGSDGDDERTGAGKTAIETDDQGPNVVKSPGRRKGRTRAAAGNLAGAVRKTTARAKSSRKK